MPRMTLPQLHPGAPLTPAPEEAALRCRFAFLVMGPRARILVEAVVQAYANSNPEEPPAICCPVDTESEYDAQIRFYFMERELRDMLALPDENAVRSTCFVFLADTRLDVKRKVLPYLEEGFTFMATRHKKVCKMSDRGASPALRTLLVTHGPGERAQKGAKAGAGGKVQQLPAMVDKFERGLEPVELEAFRRKVHGVSRGSGLVDFHRAVDFNDLGALYLCFSQIAAEMYRSSAAPGSQADCYGADAADTATDANAPTRCCVVH